MINKEDFEPGVLLKTILNERIKLLGLTKNRLAQEIGANQGQLGYILNVENTTSTTSPAVLEKCLKILGVNIDVYHHRQLLIERVAKRIEELKVEPQDVSEWTRNDMIEYTGIQEIRGLIDVNTDEWIDIYENGFVDLECTYPVFLANVLKQLEIDRLEKPTPMKIQDVTSNIRNTFGRPDPEVLKKQSPSRSVTLTSIFALALSSVAVATALLINNKKR